MGVGGCGLEGVERGWGGEFRVFWGKVTISGGGYVFLECIVESVIALSLSRDGHRRSRNL